MIRRTLAVAQITIFETLWRKHLYVLLLALVGIYFLFGRIEFFNLGVEASFIKLIPLTGISLFGIIVAVLAAARQLPDEISQRTIFPLLAKPVSRFEFLLGKFFGVSLVTSFAMLTIAAAFHLMLASKGIAMNRIYWQAVVLQVLQIDVFIALILCISCLASHAATVVLSFLLYYLLGSAGATLEDMLWVGEFPASINWFYKLLMVAIPRLDLFNISKAVIHNSQSRSWLIVLPFVGYAAFYSLLFLLIGSLLFRRKDL